jgi:hypothetical protein
MMPVRRRGPQEHPLRVAHRRGLQHPPQGVQQGRIFDCQGGLTNHRDTAPRRTTSRDRPDPSNHAQWCCARCRWHAIPPRYRRAPPLWPPPPRKDGGIVHPGLDQTSRTARVSLMCLSSRPSTRCRVAPESHSKIDLRTRSYPIRLFLGVALRQWRSPKPGGARYRSGWQRRPGGREALPHEVAELLRDIVRVHIANHDPGPPFGHKSQLGIKAKRHGRAKRPSPASHRNGSPPACAGSWHCDSGCYRSNQTSSMRQPL